MDLTWLGLLMAGVIAISCVIGYRRGFVKEIVSTFFVILSFFLVWLLNPYVNTFIKEKTPVYETVQNEVGQLVREKISQDKSATQEDIIDDLSVPGFLKDTIRENNNVETYKHLAVNTFTGYLADSLAVMAVNGLSFLISFVLANVLIRLAAFFLNLIADLPLISGVNRIAGALTGGIKSIAFIWVLLLALTLLCETEPGKAAMKLVEKDIFLSFLYEHDVLIKIFMNIFYGN